MKFGSKIARDIKPLAEYRNDAWKCVRCGICRGTDPPEMNYLYADSCPPGMYYKFESYYAAGRNEIIKCLLADPPQLEFSPELQRIIFTCTACGNCQQLCNVQKGLETTNAFQALKVYAQRRGWGPLPEHDAMIKSIINYDNPWMSPRVQRGRWAKKLIKQGMDIKDASKEKVDILYFPGCNASYVPDITPVAEATAKILHLAGVNWGILGDKERCCGSTPFRVGAEDWFDDYKKESINQLNNLGIKTMITACAGCHSTFSHQYAGELNFEEVHIIELVDRMIQEGRLKFKKPLDNLKVTYHDPCHIGRYSSIYDSPRRVLEALPGVEFKEMVRIRENALCCGSGGGCKTAFADFALDTAKIRMDEAKDAAGADIVTTCCPFCEINLGDAAKSRADGMKVVDLMELISESLGDWKSS